MGCSEANTTIESLDHSRRFAVRSAGRYPDARAMPGGDANLLVLKTVRNILGNARPAKVQVGEHEVTLLASPVPQE